MSSDDWDDEDYDDYCGDPNCEFCQLPSPQTKKDTNPMQTKHFIVGIGNGKTFTDYDLAVNEAKKYTSKQQADYFVYEAMAKVSSPVPEAEVTKL